MAVYRVTTVLEPADSKEIKMDELINLNRAKIYLDDTDQNKSKLRIEFEVSSRDENSAKELALSEIMKEIFPAIVLITQKPYYQLPYIQIVPVNIQEVHISFPLTIKEMQVVEIRSEEFHDLFRKIKRLDEQAKITLSRVIKYWNRAMSDSDPIDRFLNLYITIEILAGELVNEEYRKHKWINELYDNNKFRINGMYEGYKIHAIRAALLHYKNKELSKDEAEEIIRRHVDEFSQEVFKLIKIYLNQKTGEAIREEDW